MVFALQGFEQAIQIGGESRNPQRDIHRAVIISMIIGVILYLLLEVAFIGAIDPRTWPTTGSNPIPGQGAFGPYATLATAAGVGWLATVLYIDAVISPAGTGLVYAGTSARTSYALSRVGYVPPALGQVDKRGVPFVSLIFCWVIGMLVFLPFPSWAGMVGLVTTATVLMYAMAPPSLAALRRSDPARPRPYRLPAAKVLAPVSFVCANFIVYWAGWNTIFWLYIFIIAGFVVFFVYQAVAPPGRKLTIHWRNAAWIPPWLIGIGIISYLGQYPTSKPSSGWPFGVALLAKQTIPFWVDLGVVAVFGLAIYYFAVSLAMPTEFVHAADAVVDAEAHVGDLLCRGPNRNGLKRPTASQRGSVGSRGPVGSRRPGPQRARGARGASAQADAVVGVVERTGSVREQHPGLSHPAGRHRPRVVQRVGEQAQLFAGRRHPSSAGRYPSERRAPSLVGIVQDPAQGLGDGAATIRLRQLLRPQGERDAGLGWGALGESAIEPASTPPRCQSVA